MRCLKLTLKLNCPSQSIAQDTELIDKQKSIHTIDRCYLKVRIEIKGKLAGCDYQIEMKMKVLREVKKHTRELRLCCECKSNVHYHMIRDNNLMAKK